MFVVPLVCEFDFYIDDFGVNTGTTVAHSIFFLLMSIMDWPD